AAGRRLPRPSWTPTGCPWRSAADPGNEITVTPRCHQLLRREYGAAGQRLVAACLVRRAPASAPASSLLLAGGVGSTRRTERAHGAYTGGRPGAVAGRRYHAAAG